MALIIGVFFLAGLAWFVWALVTGTKRRNQRDSVACPRCGQFKLPRAPLCFDCTTRVN
jgi:uncharacterized OB-fold protein